MTDSEIIFTVEKPLIHRHWIRPDMAPITAGRHLRREYC